MTRTARIPSDVNRADRILGPFTARQVAILAATTAALYLTWTALREVVPLPAFLLAALPVGVCAFVVAVGQRDGLSLDRLLLAAIRHRARTRRRTPTAGPADDVPAWLDSGATSTRPAPRGHHPAGFPARGVHASPGTAAVGVVDLGPDGLVVIAALSTVNLTLRTPAEQDGLVDGFARWLHALGGPVQILVRARPLDLTQHLRELHTQAYRLPHPALAAAAGGHRDHLARLATATGEHELLTRQVLLVLGEPDGGRGAEHRLLRRLHEAATLLAPLDVSVTPLDGPQATTLLTEICNPDHHIPHTDGGATVSRRHDRHPIQPQDGPLPDAATEHPSDSPMPDLGRDEARHLNVGDEDIGDGWDDDPWAEHPQPAATNRRRAR